MIKKEQKIRFKQRVENWALILVVSLTKNIIGGLDGRNFSNWILLSACILCRHRWFYKIRISASLDEWQNL